MTRSLQILSLAVVTCLFCSCNTFIGAGKDLQSLGGTMVKKGHSSGEVQAPPVSEPAPLAPPAY
ncbi:MAG: hypothetical protein AB8F34_13240 [Akkermansiaceae bacterium]